MIYHISWQDRQGVQHDCFTDAVETAAQIKTALSSDGRFCSILPNVTPEKDEGE